MVMPKTVKRFVITTFTFMPCIYKLNSKCIPHYIIIEDVHLSNRT